MKKLVSSLMIAAAVSLSAGTTLAAQAQDNQPEAKSLDELLQLVEKNRISYFQHILCFRMLHFYRFRMIGVNRGSENLCF